VWGVLGLRVFGVDGPGSSPSMSSSWVDVLEFLYRDTAGLAGVDWRRPDLVGLDRGTGDGEGESSSAYRVDRSCRDVEWDSLEGVRENAGRVRLAVRARGDCDMA
jgi:hypothetical protein